MYKHVGRGRGRGRGRTREAGVGDGETSVHLPTDRPAYPPTDLRVRYNRPTHPPVLRFPPTWSLPIYEESYWVVYVPREGFDL